MGLFQLTYQSTAISNLDEKDLKSILDAATLLNKQLQITGCLVYYGGHFVQILEGNEEDVRFVYNKILQDKRHHSIKLLWECSAETRFFADWHMGYYVPLSDNESLFVNNYKLLSSLSDKSQGSLLSFWSAVDRALVL